MTYNYQIDYTQTGIGYIQQHAGTFPIRLQSDDWTSGDIHWLLDVVAPTLAHAAAVINWFGQVLANGRTGRSIPDRELRLHPIVTELVGDEALSQIGVRPLCRSDATGLDSDANVSVETRDHRRRQTSQSQDIKGDISRNGSFE